MNTFTTKTGNLWDVRYFPYSPVSISQDWRLAPMSPTTAILEHRHSGNTSYDPEITFWLRGGCCDPPENINTIVGLICMEKGWRLL